MRCFSAMACPAWRLVLAMLLVACGSVSWAQHGASGGSAYALDGLLSSSGSPGVGHGVWFRADYLNWWTKGSNAPALVTTSPAATPITEAGQLDEASTRVLYGADEIGGGFQPGYRLSCGAWLDSCRTFGVGADFFQLADGDDSYAAGGNGSPIIGRPFYNVQTGQQAAEMVSFPNLISGDIGVSSRDQFLSAGVWFTGNLWDCTWGDCCGCGDVCGSEVGCGDLCGDACANACGDVCMGSQLDLIAGYRYYELNDDLVIHEALTATDVNNAGTTFDITDSFRTRNEFHGGEVGLRSTSYRGAWSLGLLTKMAIGNNRQVVIIDGETTTTVPTLLPVTRPGGLLTTETNIGRRTNDQFVVIPQLGLELGYQATDHVRLLVGYNLIYLPQVLRAAEQIDTTVDPRNLPPVQAGGTNFPRPQMVSTDYWAQGINLGAELRY